MKQYGNIWFRVIVNGLKGLELPLSVEPDGFGDNMSAMECNVAAALLTQVAKRLMALAVYLQERGFGRSHDAAATTKDYYMASINGFLDGLMGDEGSEDNERP